MGEININLLICENENNVKQFSNLDKLGQNKETANVGVDQLS